jgi:hypothetical protein
MTKPTRPDPDQVPADEFALLADDGHAEPRPYDDDMVQEDGL